MTSQASPAAHGHGMTRDHHKSWKELLPELASFLPNQAPVTTFVSQNSLRFMENTPFHEALARARRILGIHGYLELDEFAGLYREGIIGDADIAEGIDRSGISLESVPQGWTAIQWVSLFLLGPAPGHARASRDWMVGERPPRGLRGHDPVHVWNRVKALPWNSGGHAPTPADDLPLIELLSRNEAEIPWQRLRQELGPLCAMYLDRGSADWSMPSRKSGFLKFALGIMADQPTTQAWLADAGREAREALDREVSAEDLLSELLFWQQPDEARHGAILRRSMMAHPGWAGMMWRLECQPNERAEPDQPVSLVDYLAVQLLLEKHLCLEAFGGPGNRRGSGAGLRSDLTITLDPAGRQARHAPDEAWDLYFAIASRPLPGLSLLEDQDPHALCHAVESFTRDQRRMIWQEAFEAAYRNKVLAGFRARRANPDPGPAARPEFQVMTCLDDREESFRRAVEELYPDAETFGGPGFFGLPIRFTPLGQVITQDQCPLHVKAAHHVREVPAEVRSHMRLQQQQSFSRMMHRLDSASRNSVSGSLLVGLIGLLAYPAVVVGFLLPHLGARLRTSIARFVRSFVRTDFEMALEPGEGAFTAAEQADRVHALMVNINMKGPFSRVVAFLGHGSTSVNNPHKSAYDCGACGGNDGLGNARLMARLLNQVDIRAELQKRGIRIPSDTWFVGGLHDTCNDAVIFEDLETAPRWATGMLAEAQAKLSRAAAHSALERCRRLHSAKGIMAAGRALRHVQGRSADLGQPRPELGHQNNAMAFYGPRSMTRGLFLDRRSFLISYEPDADPEGVAIGKLLPGILPVISGINLQYYFSRVDNDTLGSGTKLPHNPVGFLGVQEGATGDLRTGLPKQAVEIHQPLRLQVMVACRAGILESILGSQPEVARMVRNGWVRLIRIDPDSAEASIHIEGKGFVPAGSSGWPVAEVARSAEWFAGRTESLDPALVVPSPRGEVSHAS